MDKNRRDFLYTLAAGAGISSLTPKAVIKSESSTIKEHLDSIKFDFKKQLIELPKNFEIKKEESLWIPEPKEYIESGKGDCDDYATMIASVGQAKGYNVKIVGGVVDYQFEGKDIATTHMNAKIQKDQNNWYICDVNRPRTLMEDLNEITELEECSRFDFYTLYEASANDPIKSQFKDLSKLLEQNPNTISQNLEAEEYIN